MAKLTKLNTVSNRVMQDNFPAWMFFSRCAQVFLSIIILALDAFVLYQWNRNSRNSSINTYVGFLVGEPHFSGFAMFTTIVTLIIIAYVLIAPKRAPGFYHIYGELALEAILTIFWLTTFAGMANYATDYDGFARTLEGYLDDWDQNYLIPGTRSALDCQKAIAGLGALVFALCLANSITLTVHSIRKRKSRGGNKTRAQSNDPEIAMVAASTTAPPTPPPKTQPEAPSAAPVQPAPAGQEGERAT